MTKPEICNPPLLSAKTITTLNERAKVLGAGRPSGGARGHRWRDASRTRSRPSVRDDPPPGPPTRRHTGPRRPGLSDGTPVGKRSACPFAASLRGGVMGGWRGVVGLTVVSVPQLTNGVYLPRYGILPLRRTKGRIAASGPALTAGSNSNTERASHQRNDHSPTTSRAAARFFSLARVPG